MSTILQLKNEMINTLEKQDNMKMKFTKYINMSLEHMKRKLILKQMQFKTHWDNISHQIGKIQKLTIHFVPKAVENH